MTDFLLFVLLGLIFENINLFALAVFKNLCSNFSTCNCGRACYEAFAGNRKNLTELNGSSFFCIELFNEDDVTLLNLVLLSARFDNCEHEKHLTFNIDSLIGASENLRFLRLPKSCGILFYHNEKGLSSKIFIFARFTSIFICFPPIFLSCCANILP